MELRKDYILDRWVIISADRAGRPHEFVRAAAISNEQTCFFCQGNEDKTPKEISRIGNPWRIRIFPNKFAFIAQEGTDKIETHNLYYTFSNPFGSHEIIVDTNRHDLQLWDLEPVEISDVLLAYCQRINALIDSPGVKHVNVFKNHGKEAGTSLAHSHSQIAALNIVPEIIKNEIKESQKLGRCSYCDIIKSEKDSQRRVFENSNFVAFTPYASRFAYECWIFPKEHIKTITDLDESQRLSLASILSYVLRKLKQLDLSFNYFIHNSPNLENLHFHIEITPRKSIFAGFELGSEIVVNSVSPEEASRFYRED